MIPSLLLPRPPPPQHFSLDQWHTSLALDAHGGANSDAALSLRLVALSRLVRSKEAITLEHVARSPLATALLTALHALVLRVAAAAPDADPGLNDATIRMMFELPGSATRHQGQYGDFGPVQSRLPWARFCTRLQGPNGTLQLGATRANYWRKWGQVLAEVTIPRWYLRGSSEDATERGIVRVTESWYPPPDQSADDCSGMCRSCMIESELEGQFWARLVVGSSDAQDAMDEIWERDEPLE